MECPDAAAETTEIQAPARGAKLFLVLPAESSQAERGTLPFLQQSLRALRTVLHHWHLLSLDAPTVATLWTALIARSAGLRLPATSLLAMFLAVWTLYAADRLLDARPLRSEREGNHLRVHGTDLEPRHYFHHRHRAHFLIALAGVCGALAVLLPLLPLAALRLDLLLGALLTGYFVIIHATDGTRLPKEIAVGLFFAGAVCIPTIARRPDLRLQLAPVALLFAGVCSLNCVLIYRWEHTGTPGEGNIVEGMVKPDPRSRPHAATRWAVSHVRPLGWCLVIMAFLLALPAGADRADCLAVALAAALLLLLDRVRSHVSAVTLRGLADLALTTPLLLWPTVHLRR